MPHGVFRCFIGYGVLITTHTRIDCLAIAYLVPITDAQNKDKQPTRLKATLLVGNISQNTGFSNSFSSSD